MASRPQVTVLSAEGEKTSQVALPDVFQAPIRVDVIRQVHRTLLNRRRQPFGRSPYAGFDVSAESWGTGRAVSRIPRVNGSGTHRAGQGAFGNMCRGGRMFSPIKIWRNWCGRLPERVRKYAIVSAIAASSQTGIVMGRGHRIEKVAEIPLVVADDIESIRKTKNASSFLQKIGAYEDVLRCKDSKKIRAGVGKKRGRKYVQSKGPLIIYKNNDGVAKAFRNIPGVDVCSVDQLNLLTLAPGAQPGRFIVWTRSAFEDLASRFGSYDGKTGTSKLVTHGVPFRLPEAVVRNSDIAGIMATESIQAVTDKARLNVISTRLRRVNFLSNAKAMRKVNPNEYNRVKKTSLTKQRRDVYLSKLSNGQSVPEKTKAKLQRLQKRADALKNSKLRNSLMADVEQ